MLSENTTLKQLFVTKLMHHTITRCMDDASDEIKNASYNNFKEGDPYFDYKYYFNSSYFVNPDELVNNHSLMLPSNDDNKYLEPIGKLHSKFRTSIEQN